jgi:acetylornithine deacetylase/succinyl-diaminopimelate desuccinylase-like protein
MRLVPAQNPAKIEKGFTKYIKTLAPKSVSVKITSLHSGLPAVVPFGSKALNAGAAAASKAFGKKTVFTREGGTISIVVDFMEILKAPVVMLGLGLDSDDIHSPNEHFHLVDFERGLYASAYFLEEMSKV